MMNQAANSPDSPDSFYEPSIQRVGEDEMSEDDQISYAIEQV
jgi:hypothetical protein